MTGWGDVYRVAVHGELRVAEMGMGEEMEFGGGKI